MQLISERLQETVLSLIAEKGLVKGSNLATLLANRKIASRAQVYRILKNLVESEVLIKPSAGHYCISFFWLSKMSEFIEKATDKAIMVGTEESGLPELNSAVKRKFTNFKGLLNSWSHALSLILAEHSDQDLFGWIPHPWYCLMPNVTISGLVANKKKPTGKVYTIIGGDSFLDRWNKVEKKGLVNLSYAEGPFEGQNSIYYDIIGPYVITVRLDTATADSMDKLYKQVTNMSANNFQKVQDFLASSIKATIVIENKPRKANRLRRLMKEFWGV